MPASARPSVSATALAVLVALAAGVLCASCAGSRDPNLRYEPGDPSGDISGLETSLTLDPVSFAPGDTSSITITFFNSTDRPIALRFPDTRQVALLIRDAGGDLAYTDDQTMAIPTYLNLGPFEKWSYAVKWTGRAELRDRSLELPPGRYQLQAALRRSGVLYVNRTDPVDFEVTRRAE